MLPLILIGAAIGGAALQEFSIIMKANAAREELNRRTRLMEQQNLLTTQQIATQQEQEKLQGFQLENALTGNELQLSIANIGVLDKEKQTYGSMLAKEAASGLSLGSASFADQASKLEQESNYEEYINKAQFNANKLNILTQASGASFQRASNYLSGASQSLNQEFEAEEIGQKINNINESVITGTLSNVLGTAFNIASNTFTGGGEKQISNIYDFNKTQKPYNPLNVNDNSLIG